VDANSTAAGPAAPEANGVSAVLDGTQNADMPVAAGPTTTEQPTTDAAAELRKEAARTAAAEARLAEMKKAQARAAQAQGRTGTTTATPTRQAATQSATSTSSSGGPSPGKMAQLDGIVDDARSMAKQVMRSGNSANAALARNYDANLKTLKASARGVSSDKELDRLISQAKQTRAYVQFLAKQQ
jgi:hypothetical protein